MTTINTGNHKIASLVMLAVLVVVLSASGACAASSALVSVAVGGGTGDSGSYDAVITPDGHYVAFVSDATNLVAGDTNLVRDVFRRDLLTNQTVRVSVSTAGLQADGASFAPSVSADGRYVASSSDATNLVTGDTNAAHDIFVRDLVGNTTMRASATSTGVQGNGASFSAAISGDGRFVAFSSDATNLVTGDTNLVRDIFVRNLGSNTTTRVSVSSAGKQGNGACYSPALNGDGRCVAFTSDATTLVTGDANAVRDVFLRDQTASTTTRVSVPATGQSNGISYSPALSTDGRYVAYSSSASNLVAGDTNGVPDIFRYDRTLSQTKCVSLATGEVAPSGRKHAAVEWQVRDRDVGPRWTLYVSGGSAHPRRRLRAGSRAS